MKVFRKYMAGLMAGVLLLGLAGCGKSKEKSYESARNLFYYGQYTEARKAFRELEGYLDSEAMVTACDYYLAMKQLSEGEYLGASTAFAALGEYENAKGLSRAAAQLAALEQYNQGDTAAALETLKGTKLAADLENGRESSQELQDATGTWAYTLDSVSYFQEELTARAQDQEALDKDFCKDFSFQDLSAKVELKIEEDGLAVLTLAGEDLDRLQKSYASQLHSQLAAYYDGVVAAEAEEMDISQEELLENYGVSDNAGVFESDYKISMADFEKQLNGEGAVSAMQALFNGSGVALVKGESITLRFPDRQWEVKLPQDGKLELTDGENTLSFTRQP